MSVSKLLNDFSKIDQGPVSLASIVQELRIRGIEDEIRFARDGGLNPQILRGYLYRVEHQADNGISYVSTITHAQMSAGEERLVCAKELIHILDPDRIRVSEPGKLTDLCKKIVLPPEFVSLVEEEEDHIAADIDAFLEAMAILFPLQLRNRLYADYMSKRISIEWIADKVELHTDCVKSVMNGFWPQIVEILIARRMRLEETRTTVKPARKSRILTG